MASSQRPSLAQLLADIDEPAPKDVDPEDDRDPAAAAAAAHDPSDAAAAREHYLDVGPSTLRKLAQSVADPKYDGVRTSRRQLAETGDETDGASEDASEDDDDASEDAPPPPPPSSAPKRAKRTSPSDEEDEAEDTTRLSTTLREKRAEDRRKGQAVARQLTFWDALLDGRIRLQKAVSAANRLPSPQDAPRFLQDDACRAAHRALLDEALALSTELALLRETLLRSQNIDVPARPRKRPRRDGVDDDADRDLGPEAYEDALRDECEAAAVLEHIHHPHLTRTLAKWSAKIAAVAPTALRDAFRARNNTASQNVPVQVQIADVLRADGVRLVARTRVRRATARRVRIRGHEGDGAVDGETDGEGVGGEEEEEEVGKEDAETFDDTDFYQQLLRDVIDAKNREGGADAGADWALAQKQRKARKAVDTKASKGRKLRYDVHEKIQNFMVPVPLAGGGGWPDAQIDELFASLLGHGFEHATATTTPPAAAVTTEDMDADVPVVEIGAEMLKGLRVFG